MNEETLECLRRWEGCVLYAYDDADPSNPKKFIQRGMDVKGTLTIGYGHTTTVVPGQRISQQRAEELLLQDANKAAVAIKALVKVGLSENQLGALVSFVFNIGIHAFTQSTLLTKLNAGDYNAVPAELARWNKTTVGGKKIISNGLTNRRSAEIGLWSRGSFVAGNTTPAAVNDPLPKTVPTQAIAATIGVVGTAAQAFVGLDWKVVAVLIVGAAVGVIVWRLKWVS